MVRKKHGKEKAKFSDSVKTIKKPLSTAKSIKSWFDTTNLAEQEESSKPFELPPQKVQEIEAWTKALAKSPELWWAIQSSLLAKDIEPNKAQAIQKFIEAEQAKITSQEYRVNAGKPSELVSKKEIRESSFYRDLSKIFH